MRGESADPARNVSLFSFLSFFPPPPTLFRPRRRFNLDFTTLRLNGRETSLSSDATRVRPVSLSTNRKMERTKEQSPGGEQSTCKVDVR